MSKGIIELLRQAVAFDLQTVRDARAMRRWRYEAMAAVGGYDIEAQRAADRDHDLYVRQMARLP